MEKGLAPRWRYSNRNRVSLVGIELVRAQVSHRIGNLITRSHRYTDPALLVLERPLSCRELLQGTREQQDRLWTQVIFAQRWWHPHRVAYSHGVDEISFVTCCVSYSSAFSSSFPFGLCSSVIRYAPGGQPLSEPNVFLLSVALWPIVPFLVSVLASTTSVHIERTPETVTSSQKPFFSAFPFSLTRRILTLHPLAIRYSKARTPSTSDQSNFMSTTVSTKPVCFAHTCKFIAKNKARNSVRFHPCVLFFFSGYHSTHLRLFAQRIGEFRLEASSSEYGYNVSHSASLT